MACQEYKSWIPVNNGILKRRFKHESKSQDKDIYAFDAETKDYSDTIIESELKKELPLKYDLNINHQSFPWKITLKLTASDNQVCDANCELTENGIIELRIIYGNGLSEVVNLPNTVYTIIKNHIHIDNGHSQKIDTMIPCLPKDDFKYSDIARALSFAIKDVEIQMKRVMSYKSFFSFDKYISILTMSFDAKKIMSYYDSFCLIHKDTIEFEKLNLGTPKSEKLNVTPKSVMDSIDAIAGESDADFTHSKFGLTISFSAIGVAFAILMLFKGKDGYDFLSQVKLVYPFAILVFIVLVVYLKFFGKALLTPLEKVLELYQRVYMTGKLDGKLKHNNLYYFLKYGKYIFGFIFLALALGGYYVYEKYQTKTLPKENHIQARAKKNICSQQEVQIENNKTLKVTKQLP